MFITGRIYQGKQATTCDPRWVSWFPPHARRCNLGSTVKLPATATFAPRSRGQAAAENQTRSECRWRGCGTGRAVCPPIGLLRGSRNGGRLARFSFFKQAASSRAQCCEATISSFSIVAHCAISSALSWRGLRDSAGAGYAGPLRSLKRRSPVPALPDAC
jgi:hypothetical protein